VYVKDASGVRLGVQALPQSLQREPVGNGLTFGLVYRDSIRDVPGKAVVKASPVIASVYFTPDKRLTVYHDGRPLADAQ
jgi:hypothetical protein